MRYQIPDDEKMFNPNYKCNKCKNEFARKEAIESIQMAVNGTIHIRGECPKCRGFIKFIPYSDSYIVKNLLTIIYKKMPLDLILETTVVYDDKNKEIY